MGPHMYQGKTSTKTAWGKKSPVANDSNLASKCETATNTTGHCSQVVFIGSCMNLQNTKRMLVIIIVTSTLQLDTKIYTN